MGEIMEIPTRVKIKIGDHEFDAEGSAESVREQFQVFQELVKVAAAVSMAKIQNKEQFTGNALETLAKQDAAVDSGLPKIMHLDNRTVSLTVRLTSVYDAVVVMLYGQKALRSNDAVTGSELSAGLSATGGFAIGRLDRILDKLADDGDVIAFGERRGKRYRLTNTGTAKARALIAEMIATIA
jgi:hypothetical protein